MTVTELIDKLLALEAAGKGEYEVSFTVPTTCYDIEHVEEGSGWIDLQ